ncbi:2-hydroxy-acid oxidase [Balamuthia mandrillaris]
MEREDVITGIAIDPAPERKLEERVMKLSAAEDMPHRDSGHLAKLDSLQKELHKLLPPQRVSTEESVLRRHGSDLTWHPCTPPDVVVFPESTEEISRILQLCNRLGVPVIPFGKGSSLEGHISAPMGGLSFDMRRMNKVLAFHPEDMDVTVQAGVTRGQLNQHIKPEGLFFCCDPGADATLGGMAATGASGPTAMRYGMMKDMVLSLTVVLASGEVITTGKRARKSRAGYNMAALFVGSEGTLGVITELTLRLERVPKHILAMRCVFHSVEQAAKTVSKLIYDDIRSVMRCELLDEWCLKAVNMSQGQSYDEKPTLFVELHSSDRDYIYRQAKQVEEIARHQFNAVHVHQAEDSEDIENLWKARYDAWYAVPALRPEAEAFATDVAVPISRLADCIEGARRLASELGLDRLPIIGHVGSGNFHTFVLVDMNNKQEVRTAKEYNRKLMKLAQEMDGTCTAEHGIGIGKRQQLIDELGEGCVKAEKVIKSALDPNNILNPMKIFFSAKEEMSLHHRLHEREEEVERDRCLPRTEQKNI